MVVSRKSTDSATATGQVLAVVMPLRAAPAQHAHRPRHNSVHNRHGLRFDLEMGRWLAAEGDDGAAVPMPHPVGLLSTEADTAAPNPSVQTAAENSLVPEPVHGGAHGVPIITLTAAVETAPPEIEPALSSGSTPATPLFDHPEDDAESVMTRTTASTSAAAVAPPPVDAHLVGLGALFPNVANTAAVPNPFLYPTHLDLNF